jgi:AraC-like DNA-binding protein
MAREVLVIARQTFGLSRRRLLTVRNQAVMGAAGHPSFQTIPSATGGIARLACARLRRRGKDVATILSKAGLTIAEVDDASVRLEARAQIKVLDLAAEALCDELFGFRLARDFDLREIGLVYYVMASSERLTDALANAARYSGIVNEGVRLRCDANGAAIRLDYVGVDRGHDRHHAEFWMVTLVRLCRKVTESRLVPRYVKVRHRRTGLSADFKSFFGTEVTFGCDADEIGLAAAVASLPTVGRDTYLNRLLRRYAEDALPKPSARPATQRAEVERVLPELLPHGKAGIADVARRLNTSARTLSRKLGDEGAGFADIRDAVRAALAQRYLVDRALPVSEIAWLLGYREVSSFTHAFRRWTGMTPREFRLSGPHHKQIGAKSQLSGARSQDG